MMIYVWSWLVISITNIIYAALVNSLFTLQQGKRLFGLIAAASAFGGVIGGLSIKPIEKLFGTNFIILLCALALLGAYLILLLINKSYSSRLVYEEENPPVETKKSLALRIKENKYIFFLFFIVAMTVFIDRSIDLLFNTEAARFFKNEGDLASFFGIFYAATDTLMLFVGAFVYNFILRKLGVIAALLLLPITAIILTLLPLGAHFFYTFFLVVFVLICFLKLFQDALNYGLNDQSVLLLFQPLNLSARIWGVTQNEIAVAPLAGSVIGLILMLISRNFGIHITTISQLVILCSVLILIALYFIKKLYKKQLVTALAKRTLINPNFEQIGKETIEILKKQLQKAIYPDQIIYILNLLEKNNLPLFLEKIPEVLKKDISEVKLYALKKVEQYRIQGAKKTVNDICSEETQEDILSAAYLAKASLEPHSALKKLLFSKNPTVVSSGLIGLIKYGTQEEKNFARQSVLELLKSSNVQEKKSAALALKEINIEQKSELLVHLLEDSDPEIKSLALESAHGMKEEKLFIPTVKCLSIAHASDKAFQTLLSMGAPFVNFLSKHFDTFPISLRVELAKFLGFASKQEAIPLLKRLVFAEDKKVVTAAMQSLKKHGYQTDFEELAPVWEKEVAYFKKVQQLENELPNGFLEPVRSLLKREIAISQDRLLCCLAFLYPIDLILTAEAGLKSQNADRQSYALELLINTLDREDVKEIIPLLIYKGEERELSSDISIEMAIKHLLDFAPQFYLWEIKVALIYVIGKLKLSSLKKVVETLSTEGVYVLEETKKWALTFL